ncbi:MarR family winged helix-turn-helix transcriptional regulator [Streptomyces sp. NBC_01803]|uniref:MarR family winged helix-turn-helix transcriptional regulator n=1 Tax=Streptomyces sp. NBC_01803 TaxID=2975946 RepID=UPI002DD8246A|nr:MarR family transcriptional regulator [Streptomyces sp. NBC_01803]WSA44715.1 MarR family transcriptional regulator [Streptomyces sp. NBC_01803]
MEKVEVRRDFERRESLGYQVNHLARLLAQALRARIEPHGIVPGQFAQLLALYEEDGLTQQELCARVRVDQSTMAHTLKRMERDGLIHRAPDPDDRRRAIITLSDRAWEVRPALVRAALEVNATATEGLGDSEVAALMDVVARLIRNLEA